VPHEPELVLAKGGAMLAGRPTSPQLNSALTRIVPPTRPAVPSGASVGEETERIPVITAAVASSSPDPEPASKKPWWAALSGRGPSVSGQQISGAGLAGTALAVVAVIGVALGTGNTVFGAPADEASPTETITTPSTSSKSQPQPAVAPAPATTTTTTAVPTTEETTEERTVPPAPEPTPPPPAMIPGLNIPVPTLPPIPTIELPPLPEFRLPR
jgi:molecular chaperone HscA